MSVPPPTPLPPRCRAGSPRAAMTNAVPVPTLATSARARPENASAPAAMAENSGTCRTGSPRNVSPNREAPMPVTAMASGPACSSSSRSDS